MIKLKFFSLSVTNLVLRFYLMMAIVVAFGLMSQWILAIVVGYTVGVSSLLGISIRRVEDMKAAVAEQKEKKNLRQVEKSPILIGSLT